MKSDQPTEHDFYEQYMLVLENLRGPDRVKWLKELELFNQKENAWAGNTLHVRPTLSILERVALDDYKGYDPTITKERLMHDVTIVGDWECELLCAKARLSSDEAHTLITTGDDWQPAKPEHLLAFGKKFPDKQRMFPIVALGTESKIGGKNYALTLTGSIDFRFLNLLFAEAEWSRYCRFLRVRRVSS
jgi:hypothetical protein